MDGFNLVTLAIIGLFMCMCTGALIDSCDARREKTKRFAVCFEHAKDVNVCWGLQR